MEIATVTPNTTRYARCIDMSKRVRWDIDEDVIRNRTFTTDEKWLPDGLSLVTSLAFLNAEEQRFLSHVQGRTYVNLFALIERYINAKILDVSREHWFGDQVALEALIRFSDEELKHQELFRRLEELAAECMPDGYSVTADANEVARIVLSKSTWAVMALTYHVEIFTQVHYKKSIEPVGEISALWKDVFLHHWREECQHAVIDEMEWRREDAKLSATERDEAVKELIELVGAVDGILQEQAAADAGYFLASINRKLKAAESAAVGDKLLEAYRWQYIVSGIRDGQFLKVLTELTDEKQTARISEALAPLLS